MKDAMINRQEHVVSHLQRLSKLDDEYLATTNYSHASARRNTSFHTEEPNSSECVCSDLQHDDYSLSYAWFNYVLIILALPTLSMFGVATNIVNVFVYSRKRMQNSANTYLLFLACSDFLVILTGLFIFWIDSARSYIPELARAPYTTVYTLPFGYMAQTCSIYFTVAAAVDCYISVCWKSVSASYCTVRRAKQINTCIAICSIFYNSLRFPQFNLRKCFHDSSQEMIIEICPTSLFFTINTIYNVYMYMVLMTLLPFLFLLILNAIIVVRQSANAQKEQKTKRVSRSTSMNSIPTTEGKISPGGDTGSTRTSTHAIMGMSEKTPLKKELDEGGGTSDDTVTMIMVVVLFLCCNTLALIVNVIETFFEPDTLLLNFLTDGSNFLVIFNSSVNCLIYLIFNTEYRQVFMIHAKKARKCLINECWKCGAQRVENTGTQQRLLLKRAPANGNGIETSQRPAALLKRVIDRREFIEHEPTSISPVWQPLTSHNSEYDYWAGDYCFEMLGGSTLSTNLSPATSFDPNQGAVLQVDEECEGDSGWDDSLSNQASVYENGICRRTWIAEVKIVDGLQTGSSQPHIYVKPLSSCPNQKFNTTTI